MPDQVDVSVLIPVLNEEAHLRAASDAMLAQDFPGRAEFLFIDGGSEDASAAILGELAASDDRVRVLANPARRTPQALNIGLRAARGTFIARMDAHTLYPPRYLASGVERLRRGDCAWVSGPQLAVGVDPGSRLVARALGAALGKGGARFRDALEREHEVDSGFTGMWRRETLERHHGWDEEWLNDQDLELAARIRKAGGRIVCIPEMAAEYVPRSSLRALSRQYLTYGNYRVKTARRHPETLRRSQLLPPLVTVTAAGALAAPSQRLRSLARGGLAVYGAALAVSAARAAAGGARSDIAALPGVWAVMHLSYGAGFLRGSARYGPPLEAVRRAAGLGAGTEGPGGGSG
jgi:cellulose synthase/poly-beta-1,6-N-acetylglucosamine synthase-like glycosyltransferase